MQLICYASSSWKNHKMINLIKVFIVIKQNNDENAIFTGRRGGGRSSSSGPPGRPHHPNDRQRSPSHSLTRPYNAQQYQIDHRSVSQAESRQPYHQVSISSTFYEQLLCVYVPKAQKDTDHLTVFFTHLGSESRKAVTKRLMKLTPG